MSTVTTAIDWQARYEDLRQKHSLLLEEVGILRAMQEGDNVRFQSRAYQKIQRQRNMLNVFQRRLRGQRLHLRFINELGRGLTSEEWATAKSTYPEDLEDYEFEF
jgi:hypothetical protein